MFGWFKKRVPKRMAVLFDFSQIATFLALMKHYRFVEAHTEAEGDERTARAAAGANYLFGRPPNPAHLRQFRIRDIQAETREWLKENPPFRELVVQSLRVATSLTSEASKTPSVVGEDLLLDFGSEFPTAPDANNYELLLNKVIQLLPPSFQKSIRARMI